MFEAAVYIGLGLVGLYLLGRLIGWWICRTAPVGEEIPGVGFVEKK